MQTIVVEINNPTVLALLKELEELKILKIVKENVLEKKIKLSEKYKNVFSKEDALDFDKHTQTMRKEWGRI
jgi:hypothetical protein